MWQKMEAEAFEAAFLFLSFDPCTYGHPTVVFIANNLAANFSILKNGY